MDFAAYFDMIRADCDLLRVLSGKPEAASYLLRHKALHKKLVLRRFADEKPAYRLHRDERESSC